MTKRKIIKESLNDIITDKEKQELLGQNVSNELFNKLNDYYQNSGEFPRDIDPDDVDESWMWVINTAIEELGLEESTNIINHYRYILSEKATSLWQAARRLSQELNISESAAANLLNPVTKITESFIDLASAYMTEDDEDDEEVEEEEIEEVEDEDEGEEETEEVEDEEDFEEEEGSDDIDVDTTDITDVDSDWAKHYAMAQEVAKWSDSLSEHEDAKIVELAWKVETAIKNILPTIKEMEEII